MGGDEIQQIHAVIGKHSVADNPKGLMEIEVIYWGPVHKEVERWEFRYLTASRIGKSSYMNLIGMTPADFKEPGSYAKWAKQPGNKWGIAR